MHFGCEEGYFSIIICLYLVNKVFCLGSLVVKIILIALICSVLLGSVSGANAAVPTSQDVKAIVSTLGYVRGLDVRENIVRIGVVYNASDAQSQKAADAMVTLFKGGIQGKKVKVMASLLEVKNLNQAKDFQVLFVAEGTDAFFPQIAQVAREHHIASISNQLACVTSRCCMLAIDTSKGMEVYLNEEILEDLGFDVDAAFRFMVKRV